MKPQRDKKELPDINYKTCRLGCCSEGPYRRVLNENQHPAVSSQVWLEPHYVIYQLYKCLVLKTHLMRDLTNSQVSLTH